ncbi:MAG TPA: methylmalonyl Co-A mutase-associated GTPase MeaB [Bacteroidales bacterium]|nr:methylmalonyl Co-A mutase-associated GTPase MeaB [Bacteroidales bacterium]HPT02887.1 methylmalonyl Co-A mutase-associated GTPase MeaB [Bacteroidales bacterium]
MNSSKDKPFRSALKVNEGIEQPPVVNELAASRFRKARHNLLPAGEYLDGILSGNRTILSKAITLIESSLPQHQELAQEIIAHCLPLSGNSVRLGITGVPGVGKSTFIEAFGLYLISLGHKPAILAIDPSSSRSKGSILGDKTRMEELSANENAFIRPSPSAGSLGGVARKTRETIILCEAAGFDTIMVETVGVGQSETTVHSMVDFFLLLMLAGAGDELQGIKRGIMEMADAIFINKADGDNLQKVTIALAEVRNALHFFPPAESGWQTVAGTCSAVTRSGIPAVWKAIEDYLSLTRKNGYFHHRRLEQARFTMHQSVEQQLNDRFYHDPEIKKLLHSLEHDLSTGKLSAYMAAQKLLDAWDRKNK